MLQKFFTWLAGKFRDDGAPGTERRAMAVLARRRSFLIKIPGFSLAHVAKMGNIYVIKVFVGNEYFTATNQKRVPDQIDGVYIVVLSAGSVR